MYITWYLHGTILLMGSSIYLPSDVILTILSFNLHIFYWNSLLYQTFSPGPFSDSVDTCTEQCHVSKATLLRSFCKKLGVQLLLREYQMDSKTKQCFYEEDILNIFPVVKNIQPKVRVLTASVCILQCSKIGVTSSEVISSNNKVSLNLTELTSSSCYFCCRSL